jgi:hypothetical protein
MDFTSRATAATGDRFAFERLARFLCGDFRGFFLLASNSMPRLRRRVVPRVLTRAPMCPLRFRCCLTPEAKPNTLERPGGLRVLEIQFCIFATFNARRKENK